MPKRVYNNVEGHRLIDRTKGQEYIVEDVTKVGLPTVSHPTTTIEKVAGMAMDVEMPNPTHAEAMELTIYHNNGLNCPVLENPEHEFEFRIVRQRYNVTEGRIEHEGAKFRIKATFKSKEGGDIETGSPMGATCKYSVLRYEEEINGEIINCIDAVQGTLRKNGVDYIDEINQFLD